MTTGGNSTTTLTLEEERQHLERLLAQHKRIENPRGRVERVDRRIDA